MDPFNPRLARFMAIIFSSMSHIIAEILVEDIPQIVPVGGQVILPKARILQTATKSNYSFIKVSSLYIIITLLSIGRNIFIGRFKGGTIAIRWSGRKIIIRIIGIARSTRNLSIRSKGWS